MNCMEKNVFKGAKFGDKFMCRNGKMAVYLKDLGGKEYHHLLYLKDEGDTTFADNGSYYYDKEDALDIIGRFEKPVDESLQQAADEYVKKYKDFRFRNAGKKAFKDGADWQRKNVWHDVAELPNDNRKIVVIGNDDVVFSCTYVSDGNYRAWWALYDLRKCKKWCYVEDLLPPVVDKQ